MIKAVICDMDGVLIDSHKAWWMMANETLTHFGKRRMSLERFDEVLWALPLDESAPLYFGASWEEVQRYFTGRRDYFMKHLLAFQDVRPTLQGLKQRGLMLGVATNSPRGFARDTLNDVQLLEFFDAVRTGDDVVHGKPSPEMLLNILHTFTVAKQEALFVGDTNTDFEAAKNAGIPFVGMNFPSPQRIATFSDILGLL